MIIPIVIDTIDLANKFSISRKQVDDVCDNIAKSLASKYAEKLESIANDSLNRTRKRYIENIRVVDSGRLQGTVLLDYSKDKLVRMIEEGATPFDMKKGILNGPNAKISKSGKKYNTIPFRWGTPKAIGESNVFSGIMPRAIYNVAKKQDQIIPISGGGVRSSGLKEIPKSFNQISSRKEIEDSSGKILFKEYKHKTSIFSGIIKQKDSSTGQNRYFSFRRVSENSEDNSFIHPGIEQYNLIQKALNNFNIQEELSKSLDEEWDKLF